MPQQKQTLSKNAETYVANFDSDDPAISTIAIGLLNAKANGEFSGFSAWLTSHLSFLQREEAANVTLDAVKNRDLMKGIDHRLLVSKAASMSPAAFVVWLKRHQEWLRYAQRAEVTKEFTIGEGTQTVWDTVRSKQERIANQQSAAASQQRRQDAADGWTTVGGRGAATSPKTAAVQPSAPSGFCVLREADAGKDFSGDYPTLAEAYPMPAPAL